MEEGEESPFYLLEGLAFVVLFYKVGGMDIFGVFPCLVTVRISLPFDEVLKAF